MNENLMKELSEAFGVVGHEDEIAKVMEREFKKSGLKVERDLFGNVIAYKKITKNPLIIAAHMDEIGMMVKHVDEKGFIRFIRLGGIDPRMLLNQKVKIKTEKGFVKGVIAAKPPHIMKEEEMKKVLEVERLFIDIGAKSQKEAKKMGVEVGQPISFDASFDMLTKSRFTGKALDDRIGCYVLIELAKGLPENVMLIGTAQEEVSTLGKGAKVATYAYMPRAFIAVDTTIAGDHAEVDIAEAPIYLGKGPSLVLVEAGGRGNYATQRMTKRIIEIAKKAKIKYQIEAIEGGMTDAANAHNVRAGVEAIAICVPTRYIHSVVALADKGDVEETIKLVKKVMASL
ncbi:MAG: M42 family metallopeptidase [Candidatus Anstonellales archaeon]